MLKPTSDFIFIKKYRDFQGDIILPDMPKVDPRAKGELFRVLAVGPGYYLESGQRVPLDIKENDIVAVCGMIQMIPYKGDNYMIARAGDVIAFDREIA